MKITPVNFNYYSSPKTNVQSTNEHAPVTSFKGKYKATADDSKISWGIIAGVAVAAFAVAAVTVLGVKNSLNRLKGYAKDFEGRVGDFARRVNTTSKQAGPAVQRSLPPKGVILEVDVNKLRQLPEKMKEQVKAAINGAVTSEEYQKVIRDFGIWK